MEHWEELQEVNTVIQWSTGRSTAGQLSVLTLLFRNMTMERFRPRMDVNKALQILNFSSSTKLSDVSFQTLQDKFAARMEQVNELRMDYVLINKMFYRQSYKLKLKRRILNQRKRIKKLSLKLEEESIVSIMKRLT